MYGGLAGNSQSTTMPSGCILTFLKRIVAYSLSLGANDLSIEHCKIQGEHIVTMVCGCVDEGVGMCVGSQHKECPTPAPPKLTIRSHE